MQNIPDIQKMAIMHNQMQQAALERTFTAMTNMVFELFKSDYKRNPEQSDADFMNDCAERAKLVLMTVNNHLRGVK